MSALALEGVTLARGGRTVLRDVSLTVREGEFVGVLGPNGAGKTTLLRAALGLERPVAGTIRVLGRPAAAGGAAVGYMPQQRSMAAGMGLSGRTFVASAAGGARWGLPLPRAAERREVAEALAMVEATDIADRPIATLSGGERQRLLLAQTLIGRPRLLLLDEPLISLDPHRQGSVVDLVRRVQRALGIAVLFTAHELNPLLHVLDRVLYLGAGRAAIGTVEEVIRPAVLSELYGAPIDVVRAAGRIFVMAGAVDVEADPHRHGHGHDHGHHHGHAAGHHAAV